MFKWVFRQCLDAMGKKRTAEVRMVSASDAEEAIQALDVGYTATVELIHAQAQTIARLQKELQEAQSGGGASGSKEKVPKKKKEEKAEELAPEKKDEPEETEKKEELKEDKQEEQKEEKVEEVVPEEEKKDEEIKPLEVNNEGVSPEALRAMELAQPQPKIRPAPSEASSFVEVLGEDEQPRRKRGRYEQDRGEAWTCYRCLTKCGRLSKQCQVPVRQLSNPALIGELAPDRSQRPSRRSWRVP